MLFCTSLFKSGYFIWFTLANIRAAAVREFYYHEFVPFVVLTVLLFVLLFGVDFYCLHRIREDAFSCSFSLKEDVGTFIVFLYFSVTTFTTAGLGAIVPQTTSARIFVMLELFVAFFFTIFIISNIAQIRDSISKKSNL